MILFNFSCYCLGACYSFFSHLCFWGRHSLLKCLRFAFNHICYEVWTNEFRDYRSLTPWVNLRIKYLFTGSFIAERCFVCSFPRSLISFCLYGKISSKNTTSLALIIIVCTHIQYFWFVYSKTVGAVIQRIAYENVAHRFRSQFSLLT